MSRKQGVTLPAIERPRAALERGRPEANADGRSGWYRITNHATDTAEVFIYDEIGMWGVSASDLLNELAGITASSINVRINSPGGDVFDGVAIYNALLSHPATVCTTVDSLAASAASFIAMAGDTVTMMPNSQMMIHDAKMMMFGAFNSADLAEIGALLDRQSDNIASIYADAAGGTAEDWRAAMRAETWYTPQEALDAGLATSVAERPARSRSDAGTEGEPAAPVEDNARPELDPVGFRDTLRIAARYRPAQPERGLNAGDLRRAFEEAK